MEQIFKIQRPIVTNEPEPRCLIYNQDKSIMVTIPYTSAILNSVFPGGELKRYFRGTFDTQTGELSIDEYLGAQPW